MKGAVAALVKTPGFSQVLPRIAEEIGKAKTEAIFRQMVEQTEIILRGVQKTAPVYWAVAEENGTSSPLWRRLPFFYSGGGDLGGQLAFAYEKLCKEHGGAVLVGVDCPHLSPEHITCALEVVEAGAFVFGPTFGGGFYLFGGSLPIPKAVWESVDFSRDDTLIQLHNKIKTLGEVLVLEPQECVATVADLEMA